jgi:beta-phosphoglucomutase family hydrolase
VRAPWTPLASSIRWSSGKLALREDGWRFRHLPRETSWELPGGGGGDSHGAGGDDHRVGVQGDPAAVGARHAGVVSGARIDAVIFDMDGVLVDSEPLHARAVTQMLAEYGVDWDTSGGDPTIGLTGREGFAFICARHALPHDPQRLDDLYTARVVPVLRARATPLPGVPDVPRALAARGLRLGLASSSRPEIIEATLAALGVRPLFEAVVSGVEVARGKPAPDVFLETARRLGVAPEACVVVEDSERGVRAARAAGMRCVAIPCGETRHHDFGEATLVLARLPDLLAASLVAGGRAR